MVQDGDEERRGKGHEIEQEQTRASAGGDGEAEDTGCGRGDMAEVVEQDMVKQHQVVEIVKPRTIGHGRDCG